MHIGQSQRLAAIEELGTPSNAMEFLRLLDAPGTMREHFEQPSRFYAQGWPHEPGAWPQFKGPLLPLWEHREAIFVADLGTQPAEYLYFYSECPDQPTFLGVTIYHSLFEMIRRHVWEYGGGHEEVKESIIFARRLNFPDVPLLEATLTNPAASDKDIDNYKRLFSLGMRT